MMKSVHLRPGLALLLVVGALTAACGGEVPGRDVDAGNPLADAGSPHADAGHELLDAGLEPPDAGIEPSDAGVEPPDAGVQPPDAGVEPPDAGVEPPDAGVEPPDAGVEPPDGGVVPPDAGLAPPDAGVALPDAGVAPPDAGGRLPDGGLAPGPGDYPIYYTPGNSLTDYCDFFGATPISPNYFFGSCRPLRSPGVVALSNTLVAAAIEVPPMSIMTIKQLHAFVYFGNNLQQNWLINGGLFFFEDDPTTHLPGSEIVEYANLTLSSVSSNQCPSVPSGYASGLLSFTLRHPLVVENPSPNTPKRIWVAPQGVASPNSGVPGVMCTISGSVTDVAVRCNYDPAGDNVCFDNCASDPECQLSHTPQATCYDLPDSMRNQWISYTDLVGSANVCSPHMEFYGDLRPYP